MRITAILPQYPPHSRVGAWLATHECLAHLVDLGHHVTVVTHRAGFPHYVHDGVHVDSIIGPALDVAVATCDVVVSHLGDLPVAARLIDRWAKPWVVMVHGPTGSTAAEKLNVATLVVFNSRSSQDSCEWSGPSIVVHPPVDVDRFRTTPGDRVTLVNLAEFKGGELFWRLVRSAPHVQFLGVRGGYGKQIPGQGANVEVIDPTENMRDDVFARTRILLMPSQSETWGMVAVEAMASGIPVIANPTPGLVECLADAGTFVDLENGQGWLDAIESLSDHAAWEEASTRALRRSTELDRSADLSRFAAAVEAVAEKKDPLPCQTIHPR